VLENNEKEEGSVEIKEKEPYIIINNNKKRGKWGMETSVGPGGVSETG
jgi:hypothetical protein